MLVMATFFNLNTSFFPNLSVPSTNEYSTHMWGESPLSSKLCLSSHFPSQSSSLTSIGFNYVLDGVCVCVMMKSRRGLNMMSRRCVWKWISRDIHIECGREYQIQFQQPLLQFGEFFVSPQGVVFTCHRIYYGINVDTQKMLSLNGVLQNLVLHLS